MKLQKLKVNQIEVPEVRVTSRFDPEKLEQFKAAMDVGDELDPILVFDVDGKFVLCDGLHRLVEAQENRQDEITCVVVTGEMVDVLTKNIVLDHLRGKHPVSEMIQVIKALTGEFSLDSEQIAEKTGMSRDYVEKLQRISELTPWCLEALDQERIGVGHAEALTKLTDPIQQETVLHQQLLYRWTIPQLKEYIKEIIRLSQPSEPGTGDNEPPPPPKIKCYFCGEEHEIAQIANPNCCIECSGILISAIAFARQEAAKSMIPPTE